MTDAFSKLIRHLNESSEISMTSGCNIPPSKFDVPIDPPEVLLLELSLEAFFLLLLVDVLVRVTCGDFFFFDIQPPLASVAFEDFEVAFFAVTRLDLYSLLKGNRTLTFGFVLLRSFVALFFRPIYTIEL